MTTLLLVRHGATEWTTERRLQGQTDIGLNDDGRSAATRLRAAVDAWSPASVVASPLQRARETATLLSDLPVRVDGRLEEASLGDWEGKTPSAIGDAYGRWRDGLVVPPRGEPTEQLRGRVTDAIRDASILPGPVLVVTHGGVIRALLAQFVGLTADRIEPVAAPSLSVIEIDPHTFAARLRRFNVHDQSA